MSIVRDYISDAYNDDEDSFVLVITLAWDADDPDAVTLTFPARSKAPVWTFSRDLLVWGLAGEAGIGDVFCESDEDDYGILLLGSGEEEGCNITLVLKRSWVEEFLTVTTLPAGVDPYGDALDAALARILEEAR